MYNVHVFRTGAQIPLFLCTHTCTLWFTWLHNGVADSSTPLGSSWACPIKGGGTLSSYMCSIKEILHMYVHTTNYIYLHISIQLFSWFNGIYVHIYKGALTWILTSCNLSGLLRVCVCVCVCVCVYLILKWWWGWWRLTICFILHIYTYTCTVQSVCIQQQPTHVLVHVGAFLASKSKPTNNACSVLFVSLRKTCLTLVSSLAHVWHSLMLLPFFLVDPQFVRLLLPLFCHDLPI